MHLARARGGDLAGLDGGGFDKGGAWTSGRVLGELGRLWEELAKTALRDTSVCTSYGHDK